MCIRDRSPGLLTAVELHRCSYPQRCPPLGTDRCSDPSGKPRADPGARVAGGGPVDHCQRSVRANPVIIRMKPTSRFPLPIPGIGNGNLLVGFILMITGFALTLRWQ